MLKYGCINDNAYSMLIDTIKYRREAWIETVNSYNNYDDDWDIWDEE